MGPCYLHGSLMREYRDRGVRLSGSCVTLCAMTKDLRATAERWAADDPDPETAAELRALVALAASGNPASEAELADRFAQALEFGTAGLPGVLGAGPNPINLPLLARPTSRLPHHLLSSLT